MIKRVNVIASFAQDGKIKPLWFKLQPEEQAPVYKILSCASFDSNWGGRIRYRCLIQSRGKDMEINLEYNISGHTWDIMMNDSAEL